MEDIQKLTLFLPHDRRTKSYKLTLSFPSDRPREGEMMSAIADCKSWACPRWASCWLMALSSKLLSSVRFYRPICGSPSHTGMYKDSACQSLSPYHLKSFIHTPHPPPLFINQWLGHSMMLYHGSYLTRRASKIRWRCKVELERENEKHHRKFHSFYHRVIKVNGLSGVLYESFCGQFSPLTSLGFIARPHCLPNPSSPPPPSHGYDRLYLASCRSLATPSFYTYSLY